MNASIYGGRTAYLFASLMVIVMCVTVSVLLRPVTAGPRSAAYGSAAVAQPSGPPDQDSTDGLPWG